MKSLLLRSIDRILFSGNRKLQELQRIDCKRLVILGGGPSKDDFSFEPNTDQMVALCNFARVDCVNCVDFILLSDHYFMDRRIFKEISWYIDKVNPNYIVIPTRFVWSLFGFHLFRKYRKRLIFVKYYGRKVWEQPDDYILEGLNKELLQFDSVAFEFGFPLAKTLGVDNVFLFGVDLTYGEEDNTEHRVRWRQNIDISVGKTLASLPFAVYKSRKSSFGPFRVYNNESLK